MNIRRGFLALAAILGVGFAASSAHATVTVGPLTVQGRTCYERFGNENWPDDGTAPTSHFHYCGEELTGLPANPPQSTLRPIGDDFYIPLKGLPAHVRTLFTTNNVNVEVYVSVFDRYTLFGLNPATAPADQRVTPSFSLYSTAANPIPYPVIVLYENLPNNPNSPSNLTTHATTERAFDSVHEAGHQYQNLKGHLANSNLYRHLYQKDLAYITSKGQNPTTIVNTYSYWLQDWSTVSGTPRDGYEELFAEQFSVASGKTSAKPVTAVIGQYFLCTQRFVRQHYMNGTSTDPRVVNTGWPAHCYGP